MVKPTCARSLARSFACLRSYNRSSKFTFTHTRGENGIHWNFYHARAFTQRTQRQRLKTDLAVVDAIVLSVLMDLHWDFNQWGNTSSQNNERHQKTVNGQKMHRPQHLPLCVCLCVWNFNSFSTTLLWNCQYINSFSYAGLFLLLLAFMWSRCCFVKATKVALNIKMGISDRSNR